MTRVVVLLLSWLYPFYLFEKIRVLQNHIISHKRSSGFATCGEDFYVAENTSFHGVKNIHLGQNVQIFKNCRIEAIESYLTKKFTPQLIIGNNVSINNNVHIGCISSIAIADNVLIGSNVTIIDHNHGSTSTDDLRVAPRLRELTSRGFIKIESNVWIGSNVIILPNVTVGRNSVIAAGSIVTRDIKPYSIHYNKS